MQLDKWAEEYCRDHGAEPAFKGYRGFPGSLCVSINEQVVHGIPSKRVKVREGDIVSVDFGTLYKGFYGDSAVTIPVGSIKESVRSLLTVTENSLYKAIEQVRIGNRIADVSRAVQEYVEKRGYSVVREFVGHGVGINFHEQPQVLHFGKKGKGVELVPGMVFTIEPMINLGGRDLHILEDRWTAVTNDGSLSAQFEETILVTETGWESLTPF